MIGYGVANTAFGGLAIFLVLRARRGSSSASAPRRCRRRRTSRRRSSPRSARRSRSRRSSLVVLGVVGFDAETPARPGGVLVALTRLRALAFAALGLAAAGRDPLRGGRIAHRQRRHPPHGVPVRLVRRRRTTTRRCCEAIGEVLPLKHSSSSLRPPTSTATSRVGTRPRCARRPRRLGGRRRWSSRGACSAGSREHVRGVAARGRRGRLNGSTLRSPSLRPASTTQVEIRVNFGVFAGREATPAELDDLAHALIPRWARCRSCRSNGTR